MHRQRGRDRQIETETKRCIDREGETDRQRVRQTSDRQTETETKRCIDREGEGDR